ncbi:MAG: translation initiation factor IF-1 [Acidobacteriota bacterium]|jgi:translation initiation factor IF-1
MESLAETVEATVIDLLPQGAVRLELASRAQVIGHPASAARVNFTRLRPNDRVLVELSPHDKSRGRIVRLL